MNLKEKRATILESARYIVEKAKTEGRDLTKSEVAQVEGKFAEIDEIDVKLEQARKSDELFERLGAGRTIGSDSDAPPEAAYGSKAGMSGVSPWASKVTAELTAKAQAMGVKALLTGEITTPPAVTVSALPDLPTRLLDLVPREVLTEHTFEYLRQVTKTNNAAVVADNALKPTSVYTFEEVEDRARVIAHLSEPFPIRYATDHTSMVQVLDSQMAAGIFEAIENLIVNGTGTGEEWTGILNTTGVAQVAFATDMVTTLRKARTAQENKGERITAVVMNPTDIETMDLLREDGTTGGFLLDNAAYERIFGPGVKGVPSLAVPVGTALAGDWGQTRLRVRENAGTLAATQAGDLFDLNQMKLRTEGRYGFQFFRPQAMAVVDLTAA